MPTPEHLLNLLEDMMSDKGLKITTTVEENGKKRQMEQLFKNLSLAEAMKKLDGIVEQQWPDENALPQRLNDFRKAKAPGDAQPKDLKTRFDQHPEEMKQRLNYSKLCYQAMRPTQERDAEKSKLWNDLKNSLPKTKPNGKRRLNVESFRFGQLLMETDGSKESENFNDKVFSLLAVASRAMTWEEFEERRYQSGIKAGMSEEAAKKAAKLERDYGIDALADIYRERVYAANEKMEDAIKAASMIVSGKETDVKKLADAYELIHDPGFEMMFLGTSAYGVFTRFVNNYEQRKDALAQQAREIEDLSMGIKPLRSLAEEIVSPHYAYLDAANLFDAHLNSGVNDVEINTYVIETTVAIGQGSQANARPPRRRSPPTPLPRSARP